MPILGQVQAGMPVEAIENIEAYVVVDGALARQVDFVVRVKGDSMEPTMMDGDLALVERDPDATNGESVVARVDHGDATIKRFRRRGKEVWLEPENAKHKPIRGRPFSIVGRVRGIFRLFPRR